MKRDSAIEVQPAQIKALYLGLLIAIAVLLGLFGFGKSLLQLIHRWRVQEEYSHGFLIPFIVAWLLWSRRDALRASIGQPSWSGPALIVLAAGMHIIGELSAVYVLSQLGFIAALFGIVLAAGGNSLLKVTFVPIIFLIFAIPVPYFIDAELSFKLQLISSQLGADVIRLLQIPVLLEGNVIDLGTYKLQVVEACSGLRYLYPLMSLGFLAAYMFQAPFWQRALVFLSTIPITILMNSFRIGVVGVMVNYFGPQDADGFLHMFEGWIIFVACAGVLVGEMALLARLTSGRRFLEVFYAPNVKAALQDHKIGSFGRAPIVTSLLLICAICLSSFLVSTRHEIIPERKSFALFPTDIGSWHGNPGVLDQGTAKFLGLTDYITSDYSRADGHAVNLYVAYYASQRSGLSPHSPSVCIPGNGWQIASLERTHFQSPNLSFPLNRAIIEYGSQKEQRQLVYYWYDERGKAVANEWWSKFYLLRDAIFKNRTDGALVRLTTPIYAGEQVKDAEKRLYDFTRIIVPQLTGFLPSQGEAKMKPAMISPKPDHS